MRGGEYPVPQHIRRRGSSDAVFSRSEEERTSNEGTKVLQKVSPREKKDSVILLGDKGRNRLLNVTKSKYTQLRFLVSSVETKTKKKQKRYNKQKS